MPPAKAKPALPIYPLAVLAHRYVNLPGWPAIKAWPFPAGYIPPEIEKLSGNQVRWLVIINF